MRVAIDTNVLAYGEGVNDRERALIASEVVARLPVNDIVVPVQVRGELFSVLQRKGKLAPARARAMS